MVMLNFDTRAPEFANATQDGDFEPIKEGEYIAQIIKSEKKQTRAGSDALHLTWQIIDGEYKNRQLWEQLYLYDPSRPKQLSFNRNKLFHILAACGKEQISDTGELHNRPVRITVKIDEYNGRVRNIITRYVSTAPITAAQPQAQQTRTETVADDVPF